MSVKIAVMEAVATRALQHLHVQSLPTSVYRVDDFSFYTISLCDKPYDDRLPDAPNMEIYCLYVVGIPIEWSYVYKLSPSDKCKSIPYMIDSSADGDSNGCLRSGVNFVDGDESVPVVSAGYMCAKGWKGKARFNPPGMATYVREYRHKAPAIIFERRGLESGAHVDIMGNIALIEDVMRCCWRQWSRLGQGERIKLEL